MLVYRCIERFFMIFLRQHNYLKIKHLKKIGFCKDKDLCT